MRRSVTVVRYVRVNACAAIGRGVTSVRPVFGCAGRVGALRQRGRGRAEDKRYCQNNRSRGHGLSPELCDTQGPCAVLPGSQEMRSTDLIFNSILMHTLFSEIA